jgi:hypothetical protein
MDWSRRAAGRRPGRPSPPGEYDGLTEQEPKWPPKSSLGKAIRYVLAPPHRDRRDRINVITGIAAS